jgi:glycosyltransferase involved in cell wall biosynthesis
VPTKNSMGTIEACLTSIKHQSVPVQIVVVDNSSTDGTREVARSLGCEVLLAGPERSRQRNVGAAAAYCDWLLFVDSDMRLESGVVESCIHACRDEDAHAAVVPELAVGDGFLARCRELEKLCYLGDPLIEAARFFERDMFSRLGGYDESILAGPEDWDLPARLRKAGGRITRGDIVLWHMEGRIHLKECYKTKRYYGMAVDHYRSEHPEIAAQQFSPLRSAFLRNWKKLITSPHLAAGLFVLKAVEYAGLKAGIRDSRKHDLGGVVLDEGRSGR